MPAQLLTLREGDREVEPKKHGDWNRQR